jgi:hypothetical protein
MTGVEHRDDPLISLEATGSPDDAVAQVGHARGLEHADELKCGLARLEAIEEALTRPEDDRVHLEVDLVDEPSLDRLPGA